MTAELIEFCCHLLPHNNASAKATGSSDCTLPVHHLPGCAWDHLDRMVHLAVHLFCHAKEGGRTRWYCCSAVARRAATQQRWTSSKIAHSGFAPPLRLFVSHCAAWSMAPSIGRPLPDSCRFVSGGCDRLVAERVAGSHPASNTQPANRGTG